MTKKHLSILHPIFHILIQAKFSCVKYFSKKLPVLFVSFTYNSAIGIQTKTIPFSIDTGFNGFLQLCGTEYDSMPEIHNMVINRSGYTAGGPVTNKIMRITIDKIKLNNKNLLKEPMKKSVLIFNEVQNVPALIGTQGVQKLKLCFDFKNQILSSMDDPH